jgi:enoyl-CoA hydratase/carnithine racemase
VCTTRLHNPERRNAGNLVSVLDEADADPDVRVIVVTERAPRSALGSIPSACIPWRP